METTYRVGKRRMYLQVDEQGLLIDVGDHLHGPDVIEVEALDVITTDGPTYYDGRRLNLDADALLTFLAYLHKHHPTDTDKVRYKRIQSYFPGSAFIRNMIRALMLVYIPNAKGTAEDTHFKGRARKQLDRWAGVD